jgi:predicted MFS family arabinose efflux permease
MFTGFVGIAALAFTGNASTAWPLVALFGLAYGTQQTVYFALAMKYTIPSIAASMFAILMAVTNIGQGAGMAVSGMLVDASSFRVTFMILALLNFLALPLLPKLFNNPKTKLQSA